METRTFLAVAILGAMVLAGLVAAFIEIPRRRRERRRRRGIKTDQHRAMLAQRTFGRPAD